MLLYIPSVFLAILTPHTAFVSLATFSANVPVIFVTFRSPCFQNDSVAKIVASLAVSDIVNGIIAACCAGVAWSLQSGDPVPTWLLRLINSGMCTLLTKLTVHLGEVFEVPANRKAIIFDISLVIE